MQHLAVREALVANFFQRVPRVVDVDVVGDCVVDAGVNVAAANSERARIEGMILLEVGAQLEPARGFDLGDGREIADVGVRKNE